MPDANAVPPLDEKLMRLHDAYHKHVFDIDAPEMMGSGMTWEVKFCACGALRNQSMTSPPAAYGLKSPWSDYVRTYNLHAHMAAMGYKLNAEGTRMVSRIWC
jgi:hypothetical protein